MLYKRPDGIKYTDMAIYIDEHIYTDSYDVELVYQYLYLLINMLAHKQKLFSDEQDYDDFSITFASKLYLRLTNKKQFQLNDKGEPRLKRIKSVLNYIKKTIYLKKIEYDEENRIIDGDMSEDNDDLDSVYSFSNCISESTESLDRVEFESCLGDIINSIDAYLCHIPYKKHSIEYTNIYTSCLLSFLNTIVLSKNDISRINNLCGSRILNPKIIENIYKQQSNDFVILYHLPEEMRGYIQVLTNGIKHYIAKDLSWQGHCHIPASANMKSLFVSELYNAGFYKDKQ